MAQTKFKLDLEEESGITHAHTQKTKPVRPLKTKMKKTPSIATSFNLSLNLLKLFEILTPVQKQQLMEYAQEDDKTADYVIKKLLMDQGIIEVDTSLD